MLVVDANRLANKLLCLYVDLSYQRATSGIPLYDCISKDDFVSSQRKMRNVCACICLHSLHLTLQDIST